MNSMPANAFPCPQHATMSILSATGWSSARRVHYGDSMRRKCMWALAFLAIAITASWSQTGGERQPANTGEQNQTAATPDQEAEPRTDHGQQSADSGEQTQTAPMPGQDIEPK